MFCNLNGKFFNDANATIGINNRSFRYGDGCFETIKVFRGNILMADLHMDRVFRTMARLHFTPPTFFNGNYLLGLISELLKKNGHQKLARVRLTIFRGDGGLYDPINQSPKFLIQSWPLNPENNSINENGLILGSYDGGFKAADSFANLKTNNQLIYAMAAMAAKDSHCNDILVKNHLGSYADTTIANVWIIKDGVIMTPPLSDGGVDGVMRAFLLKAFSENGIAHRQQSIFPEELELASEVFLTNSIYGLKWVRQAGSADFSCDRVRQLHRDFIAPQFR